MLLYIYCPLLHDVVKLIGSGICSRPQKDRRYSTRLVTVVMWCCNNIAPVLCCAGGITICVTATMRTTPTQIRR